MLLPTLTEAIQVILPNGHLVASLDILKMPYMSYASGRQFV